jgi:hypothetical protein
MQGQDAECLPGAGHNAAFTAPTSQPVILSLSFRAKDPFHLHVRSKAHARLLDCGRAATALFSGRRRQREQATSATRPAAAEKAAASPCGPTPSGDGSRLHSKARLRAPGYDEIPGSFTLKCGFRMTELWNLSEELISIHGRGGLVARTCSAGPRPVLRNAPTSDNADAVIDALPGFPRVTPGFR